MNPRRSVLLAAAFAALLTISAVAAWAVWRNTREAQANAENLYQRDLVVHEALGEVRSNVYLAAILARDYLLEPVTNSPDYLNQFDVIKAHLQASTRTLERTLQGEEVLRTLERLQMEIDAYAKTTQVMLTWTAVERDRERADMLRLRGNRRRDILTLTERIQNLAIQSSAEQRKRIQEGDQYFRSSLGWIAGMALLLGVGVAGLTLARVRALEKQSEVAESELRSLSGQLRTAQEQERKFLSRELHDQVGQMLTGLRMELTAISRSRAAVDREMNQALDRAKTTVEQTLGIVRNIAMLLRPSMLDDLGLTPALTWLIKEVSRTSGMEIHRDIDPLVDQLPEAHRTCLYRVVQEALTNASRHSGARTVELRAHTSKGWVDVTITDDGRGFDATLDKKRGLGLLGMEERVRELGGQLQVSSVPGRGTSVRIRLPQPIPMEASDGESSDRRRSRDRADRAATTL